MRTSKHYTKGYTARQAGAHPGDNPYKQVAARAAWNDGWAVADQEIADAAPPVIRHHTVGTVTQGPPMVVIGSGTAATITHWQKATNLRDIPCPGCGALRCSPEGTTNHAALATKRVGREVAYLYCRECTWTTSVPVRRG